MLKFDEDKKVSLEFKDLESRKTEVEVAYKWDFNKKVVNR